MVKNILIYGDSNVWGDNFLTGQRIPRDKQWPIILMSNLNNNIIQEGLPGRIAGCNDVKKYKNGRDSFISIFRTAAPVDYIVISLGTNDLQLKYNKTSEEIISDLLWYKNTVEKECSDDENKVKYFVDGKMPKIYYLLPANFDISSETENIFNLDSEGKRTAVREFFLENYPENSIVIENVDLFEDGIHYSYEGHEMVAKCVERKIKEDE